jgi:hypothetical protein
MERWCGSLLPAVKSRVNPYITLSRRQLHLTQLAQILARYNLYKEVGYQGHTRPSLAPTSSEHVYDECE